MQQAISDTPFLPICVEGHGLVIEAYDLSTTLLMLMVKESDGIADGHFMSAQASLRIIPDSHIDTIQIDGGVGNQPVLSRVGACFEISLGAAGFARYYAHPSGNTFP